MPTLKISTDLFHNVLIKHKENCLSIHGKQSVKLEKGIIKFENYFKQISVPFKIYADFECNLKSVECNEGSYDRFTKPTIIYRGENAAYEFIKAILKEYKYSKKIMKEEHFKKVIVVGFVKNLLMMKKKLEIIAL